ncbi:MAG: PKD domain-containing protein [Candidatus Riflebacteria bacterium]|nr:PKD domain-containing protein [Candidatus Riflebacteria bacterium]
MTCWRDGCSRNSRGFPAFLLLGLALALATPAAWAENQWPVADAGRFHVTCVGNGPVTLHGRGADPDGDAVTYAWRQSDGPAVLELAGADTPDVTVTPAQAGTYVLALTVSDGRGGTGVDTARVVGRLQGGGKAGVREVP